VKHPLEYDSIQERKIDQLPVILYVSLTKKFIGLREEKGAARGLKKAGLKDALQLYCHRYKNAHTDHVSNRDARTGNQGMFKGDRHILCKNQGQWPDVSFLRVQP
jgi:hypothetical protein